MNYYEVKPEDNHFKVIFVDLTHRCNMDCFNCYLPNRTIPDMNENMLYDVLSRLPERAYIRLIGAEPTLRKDLPEIISKVLEYGHKPSVTTNGLKLASLK
jgi:cyclic pyranopterin phosphate synthase